MIAHFLLRFALLFWPREYRLRYAESIYADTQGRGINAAVSAVDVAAQGIGMRLEDLFRDVGHGSRALLKSPLFSAIAIAAIGIGVGANVAIGSVMEGVMLRGLPFPDAQNMYFVSSTPRVGSDLSIQNLDDIRSANHTFTQLGAATQTQPVLTGRGAPTVLNALTVDGGYFPVLGVAPQL